MKKLVVLDLDSTLIHTLQDPVSVGRWPQGSRELFHLGRSRFDMHYRPHVKSFINELRRMRGPNFKVAVWTAAHMDYAKKVLDYLWPAWRSELHFMWSFNQCTVLPSGDVFKDLRKLPIGFDVLLLDDSNTHYLRNTNRGFSVWKIKPFLVSNRGVDEELLRALQYIQDTVDRGERFAVRPKTPSARLPSRGVSSSPSRLRVK